VRKCDSILNNGGGCLSWGWLQLRCLLAV
jgi:hypothetical protein